MPANVTQAFAANGMGTPTTPSPEAKGGTVLRLTYFDECGAYVRSGRS